MTDVHLLDRHARAPDVAKDRRTLQLLTNARRVIGFAAVFLAVGSIGAKVVFSLDWTIVAVSLALVVPFYVVVASALSTHPHATFGPANAVTTIRAAMTILLGAVALLSSEFQDAVDHTLLWAFMALSAVVLALDGLDGYLARITGQQSAFGARYDMEVDAFLILVLSLAIFMLGKAGVWVLLIGAMRYLFVTASLIDTRLAKPLPASLRRKAICVAQVGILCILLVPWLTPPLASALAACALLALTYSFAVDCIYLLSGNRRR